MHPDIAKPPQTDKQIALAQGGPGEPKHRWAGWVAVSTAIFAALASIASLMTARHTDEAMIDQIRASDSWAFFQAKGIKAAVLEGKIDLLPALGKEPSEKDTAKVAEYRTDQGTIKAEAEKLQAAADDHRHREAVMGRAATMFQVAIALCAIAILTKRLQFWHLALLIGVAGVVFMVQGLL